MAIIKSSLNVNELIREKESIAKRIAYSFVRKYPSKKDDIIAAAYLGLVTAINNWENVAYDENIDPYINVTVVSKIKEFLHKDALIPVPRKRYAAGRRPPDIFFFDYSDSSSRYLHPQHLDRLDNLLKEDLIKKLKLSTFEVQVIEMRMSGYTFREIGPKFGRSGSWAKHVINEIRRKAIENGKEILSDVGP